MDKSLQGMLSEFFRWRAVRTGGRASKYTPHQGEQEKARRRARGDHAENYLHKHKEAL